MPTLIADRIAAARLAKRSEPAIIRDADAIARYAEVRHGVAKRVRPWDSPLPFMSCPEVWIKSRLCEADAFPPGCPMEGDELPFMVLMGKLQVSGYARSKMFTTTEVVFPINLVSGKVAGFDSFLGVGLHHTR